MIVYRELSSLTSDLGYSAKALYTLSNAPGKHYRCKRIPKGDGAFRRLYVPDDFLKAVQRSIGQRLLAYARISPYATAYRPCGSTRVNASPHVGQPVVLKLDIAHFFDNLLYPIVKERAFPEEIYGESLRVLLTLLCVYPDALPQGAPTSPLLCNIILREFDDAVGLYCGERNIRYTRYCDDMTFSGSFDPGPVIRLVKEELKKVRLFLNDRKTVILHDGQRKLVTGIVVNEKASVPREYVKQIRQDVYYCKKFGVPSHIARTGLMCTEAAYAQKLLGRISYALSVAPNPELEGYGAWLRSLPFAR